MARQDSERFFSMGEVYDRMCRRLVPQYDWLHDVLIDLLQHRLSVGPRPLFVDLGAGSGILLQRLLTAFPTAEAVWIDYSDDFLQVARRRLAGHAPRVHFLHSSLQTAWEQKLPRAPDAIVSMSAIHHLTDCGKGELYRRCCRVLRPGGWFCNVDEMRPRRDDAYRRAMEQWVSYVEAVGSQLEGVELEHYRGWMGPFGRWQARNLEGFGAPKQEGDDMHAPYDLQLRMLEEAGYQEVELFAKYHLFCLIGGVKPAPDGA